MIDDEEITGDVNKLSLLECVEKKAT